MSKRIVEIEILRSDEDQLEEDGGNESITATVAPTQTQIKINKYASKNSRSAPTGIDPTIFRYMYQDEEAVREAIDNNITDSQQIMMEKSEFQAMRAIVKNEKPTLASTLVSKPLVQSQLPAVKMEIVDEKKDSDVTMTPAEGSPPASSSSQATSQASVSSSSSSPSQPLTTPATQSTPASTGSSATSTNTVPIHVVDDDDDADSNLVPIVSIAASKSQQSVILAGRVVYDANDTSGETSSEVVQKLTQTSSVWIEGDRTLNNGARIQVRLNGLKTYALFPGQVILTKGINATGASFVAEDLFTDASLPHLGIKRSQVEKYNASLGFRPLGIIFAAGPFTTSDDLSFAPLFDLLRVVQAVRPDLLILQGPFLEAEHKEFVANEGATAATYDVLFARLLGDIMTYVSHLRTKVLILPSVRDAAGIPVFPQPPLNLPSQGVPSELHRDIQTGKLVFLPNPCTFRVNDIVIGCSSMDVISHLTNSNEVHKAAPTSTQSSTSGTPVREPPGRLQRLASHLVTSHSFYPLYPPPDHVYLDFSRAASLRMPVTPDILFMPSKMKHFVADLQPHKSIVVNPEYLTKGPSGGTYALVAVHPLKDEEMVPLDDSQYGRIYDHCMITRTRVDILRI